MSKKRKKKSQNKKKNRSGGGAKPQVVPENYTLDKSLCLAAKEYRLKKVDLKAICTVESAMDTRAYRYEHGFWNRYMKDNPEWRDSDPRITSASYGLMQLMYVVAVELGFSRSRAPEELYDPLTNVMLGAKLIRKHLDYMAENPKDIFKNYWPMELALAWYNGGRGNNPDPTGQLRNPEYVQKVRLAKWILITSGEEDCK